MSQVELTKYSSQLLNLRNSIREKEELLKRIKGGDKTEEGKRLSYSEAEKKRSRKIKNEKEIKKIKSRIKTIKEEETKKERNVIELIPTSDENIELSHKYDGKKRIIVVRHNSDTNNVTVNVEYFT